MRFSEEVCEKLGNYVYRLIDPRNGETFYVGKGKANRVFDHAAGVSAGDGDGDQILGAKLDRIRAIKNAGLSVTHVIHRHEVPDDAIFVGSARSDDVVTHKRILGVGCEFSGYYDKD